MAFLGPALRWPDAVGVRATEALSSVQPHLSAPLSSLSPDVLLAVVASFAFILLLTLASSVLQKASTAPAAVTSGTGKAVKSRETPNVVLVGPSGVGKTSIFSALAFDSVPSVHPSQRESETIVCLSGEAGNELNVARKRNVHIIDTPGHPRIKDRIIGEHIKDADVVVFCVDAKEALRGSVSAGQTKDSSIVEAVDHLHAAMMQLAKCRRNAKTRPPTLLLLFTRSDLSPHLSNVSLESDSKRLAILLSRAQGAVEQELGRRRAGMGLGAKQTTKVGGMSKVEGGGQGNGMWATVKLLLGWRLVAVADAEEDEELEQEQDYLDKDAGVSATASLDRLKKNVVLEGKVRTAFASLGTERGWTERKMAGLNELKQILLNV